MSLQGLDQGGIKTVNGSDGDRVDQGRVAHSDKPPSLDARHPEVAQSRRYGGLMKETILVGQGKEVVRSPGSAWEDRLAQARPRIASRLDFMSKDHHAIRNHAVRELPRLAMPMAPAAISETLGIPLPRTLEVLDDLEARLFFLVRNGEGDVSWAFPVTVESTGHRLAFSTGERLDAA